MKNLLLIIGLSLVTNLTFAQVYEGTTTHWGKYSVSFATVNNEGVILYDKVFNFFTIKKIDNTWTVKGLNSNETFLLLKYHYDNTSKRIKLASTPTLNAHNFDKTVIKTQKQNGKYAVSDEEICKALAVLTHDIVLKKFKTYQFSGDRTCFFSSGMVYVGPIENKKRHGKGIQYTKKETQKGTWKENKKHGHFNVENTDGMKVKAYFENDKKEGTWTINYADSGISEVVYKNDEQVSTKVIKERPKKKWNPTIKSEYEMFLFELGTPESLDEFISDRAKQVRNLNKDIPLRSMQSIVKPIKYKIDARIAGINAASKRLNNMLKTANEVGCTSTANHIKNLKKQVNSMHNNYIKAYDAFNEQQFTKSSETFKSLISKGFDHVTKAREDYNNLVPLVNSMNDYACTKTKIVNPTPKPKVAKVYKTGIRTQHNNTATILSISSVQSGSVAYKAGIRTGDKLIEINGQYVCDWIKSAADSWLETTNSSKVFEIVYYDASSKSEVTVKLKPLTNEYEVVKTEKLEDYINDSNWGGKKYTGNLYLRMPHGKGKVTFANGDVYDGTFDMGEMTGQGTMAYSDGRVYKGNWRKGKHHGRGVLTMKDGVEHHGKFDKGRKIDATFYVVYSDDKIIREYYNGGKCTERKQVSLETAAKYIGRTYEKPKPKPTTTTAKKEIEYVPNEMPVFTGKYEGNDLVLLMGRHIDDTAIQKWLTDGFKASAGCDNDFCIYRKAGVSLEFTKSHLSEMNIYQNANGSFTGSLPQNLKFNAPISSLNNTSVKWTAKTNEMYPHKYYYKNGVKVSCYFDDKTSSKISSFKLTKKIVANPKGGKAGVGLVVRDDRYGKFSVSNTHHGWAAKKAGMYEGMQILEVDGQPVKDKGKYGIEGMLEGEIGTTVTVKFAPRNQPDKWKIYELTRGANGKAKKISDYKSAASTSNNNNNSTNSSTNNSAEQVGIGISYMKGKESDIYEITWLSSSSAAYKAGIRRFDNLLKINGVNVGSKSSSEIKTLLKGNKGTSVKVTVERDGKEMEFTVIR